VNVKNGLVHVLGVKEMVLIMLVLVNQLDLLDAEFLKHAHVIFIQHVVNVLIAYIVHGVEVEIKNVLKELIVTLAQCQQLIAHATLTKIVTLAEVIIVDRVNGVNHSELALTRSTLMLARIHHQI